MNDRTALVTGANKGIGRHIASQLAAEGFTVYATARTPAKARQAEEIGCLPLTLDVTDQATIDDAAAKIHTLDVLVNNAGISPTLATPQSTTLPELRSTFETNVFGVMAVTNAFLPALHRSPHPRIVNVSSGTGSLTWSTDPDHSFSTTNGEGAAYRASKTALNALTIMYAQSLAEDGFKVNALAPGLRATDLNDRTGGGGDPAEAAEAAVQLALLPDDGPTGAFFLWDGTTVPW